MNYSNKIHILLPYKESFYKNSAGAVSLYVNEFIKFSKFKNNLCVIGVENKGKLLNNKYLKIKKSFKSLFYKNKNYLESYIKIVKSNSPLIIEVHNRPSYVKFLSKNLKSKIVLFFHNDPNQMLGSKTKKEKLEILEYCEMLVFNSIYIKNCFFNDINENFYLNKYKVIYNSTSKLKKFPKKQKIITFVGKLNYAKGYDIYVNAINKILNDNPDYKSLAIGEEKRRKIFFQHERFRELGFLKNSEVIKILKKTDIAVIPSRWNEPFGRTALEASKCGCYTICSSNGGLAETSDHCVYIKDINAKSLFNSISSAIKNVNLKKRKQLLSFKNVKHELKKNSRQLDMIREDLFSTYNHSNKKIINIYNVGIKSSHRLYNISIGKKLTAGFIKNGYDVLEISDRDFTKGYFENISFENYLLKSIKNYEPSILFFGHSKLINYSLLFKIKNLHPKLTIAEWNEDYLGPKGPDNIRNFNSLKIKEKLVDYFFVTTHPNHLLKKLNNSYYFGIPVDKNIENRKQYKKNNLYDLFFTLSHGVNRGTLKKNKVDEREIILKKIYLEKEIKCNFFGINNREPVWADKFYSELSKCNMGLNLSRGDPVCLYSSNRIASYIGNGLLTFLDKKTGLNKFFNSKEVVFYNNFEDLINKINFYKKNDNLRKKIAKNGYLKYHKIFNNKAVTRNMLNLINKKLKKI